MECGDYPTQIDTGTTLRTLFNNPRGVSIHVYSEHSSSILKGNPEEIQQKTLQSTQEEPGGRQDRKA
jgi:hypothetical protein